MCLSVSRTKAIFSHSKILRGRCYEYMFFHLYFFIFSINLFYWSKGFLENFQETSSVENSSTFHFIQRNLEVALHKFSYTIYFLAILFLTKNYLKSIKKRYEKI